MRCSAKTLTDITGTPKHPSKLLGAVEGKLVEKYGRDCVQCQRRSVSVSFDVAGQEERVLSFDVVPAYDKDHHYEIPDTGTARAVGRIPTQEIPRRKGHGCEQSVQAGEWKGMVRMIKRWNVEKDKPVRPSFFLEVMALDLLRPPFGGDYRHPRFQSLFAVHWRLVFMMNGKNQRNWGHLLAT